MLIGGHAIRRTKSTAAGAHFLSARGTKRAMGRVLVYMALMAAAAFALAGCGFTDARSPVPEFMRARAPEPPPPEAPPDVRRIVAEKLDSVFTAASQPRQVRVSPPRHDLRGSGWTACVKAETTSVTGKPLGTQTYRITITDGVVSDRRQIEADDICVGESYEPI
jgi:hypothetical protein